MWQNAVWDGAERVPALGFCRVVRQPSHLESQRLTRERESRGREKEGEGLGVLLARPCVLMEHFVPHIHTLDAFQWLSTNQCSSASFNSKEPSRRLAPQTGLKLVEQQCLE
jgi:hypothetical protein